VGCGIKIEPSGILKLILICVILTGAAALNCGADRGGETEVNPLGYFVEQIEKFKDGEKFRGKVSSGIAGEELTEEDIRPAAVALKYDTGHVAMQSARMLVQLGFQRDPLFQEGIRILRDELILDTLLKNGLSERGPLADYILEAVRKYTPPEHISGRGKLFLDMLESEPDQTLLLIIAKGKVAGAAKILNREEIRSRCSGWEEYRIALAAMGDEELESSYINEFMQAGDPEKKASLAAVLGRIGTREALTALAKEVRTGLVIEMPNVMRKSVRLDIISALGYNFPDRKFLYDNAITGDEDYARVEEFCRENFGVSWDTERPDFLTVQGFPSEPSPQ
jgi:hypothetical protein